MNFLQKLNPLNYFDGKNHHGNKGAIVREGNALGPYNSAFSEYVFREFNPHLYEAMREAMGPIDGAINKMVMLDGVIQCEAGSDSLQREIDEWMEGVQVNDVEQGFQAFYRSQGNEMYEQGCTIGDYYVDLKARDVTHLRVGDSKGIYFQRNKQTGELERWYAAPAPKRGNFNGTENVERVLRNSYQQYSSMTTFLEGNNYKKLDPATLIYAGYNNEADNPYGVSLMRSTEYDTRVLLIMKNALGNTWERFGDPIFNVTLKKKAGRKSTQDQLAEDRNNIAKNLSDVMAIKKSGNSADVVNIIGPDDEFNIEVLGGDGQVLEIEMPARHLLENLVAKTGLPSWMLGFHWSTAERLAGRQSEIVLQESETRFTLRKPQLIKPILAMLRARGLSFDSRDLSLIQNLPNLQDMEAKARSNLMNAQAEAIRNGGDLNPDQVSTSDSEDDEKKHLSVYHIANSKDDARLLQQGENIISLNVDGKKFTADQIENVLKPICKGYHHKSESYVEDTTALTRLERKVERALLSAWDQLYDDVIAVLDRGFNKNLSKLDLKANESPVFVFDAAIILQDLKALQDDFIGSMGAEDGVLHESLVEAWERGIANAMSEDVINGLDLVTELTRVTISRQLQQHGMQLVRDDTVRAFGNDVLLDLEHGAYNGLNPKEVASKLRKRFDAHDYDWQRLARSEIADAQASGKLAEYSAQNINKYNWVRAGGACTICIGLEKGSPYQVGAGPRPMRDSHPNCRCTVTAYIE